MVVLTIFQKIITRKSERIEAHSNPFTEIPTRKWTGERVAILNTGSARLILSEKV